MKNRYQLVVSCLMIVFVFACEKNTVHPESKYECSFTFNDTSESHPKADIYQQLLENHRKINMIGAVLLVKDKYGFWIGSSGKSDVASNVDMQPCNRFLIASISKMMTAAAIYRYVDAGLLDLSDPVSKWVDPVITENIENLKEANIGHLLSHTSGIGDFFTLQFQLDFLNNEYNDWRQEDVIEYAYGVKPTNAVGEYHYCNTGYVLLGLILEKVSGKSLEQVYKTEIFEPLNLTTGYFDKKEPIPTDVAKGYADIYGNGQYVESTFLYKDDISSADGGIAMNSYDLAMFMEGLMKGNLISDASLDQMTNWFDLPENWVNPHLSQTQNGYGIEHFTTEYGNAVGHTGALYGFTTLVQYFPEHDATYILLLNCAVVDYLPQIDLYHEVLDEMFK